ncbi:uncharacterized protein LOC116848925 isoform X2 [Odontomachus brunneus]|uniref:uncharacterized protein LOC116848925 isoform X2 n=1 Tax=Odontomachus brunneus TaxID=486640 RepID=UPI0013F2AB0E|nr:uncharacterized protein LOC116848925 isoform X2 [Odontomachus brunneus]
MITNYLQEEKILALQNFWEKGLLRKNDSHRLTSSTEISQLKDDWIEYKRAMKSEKEKTLLDYIGPAITEDSDIRNDQVLVNHVRVKRSDSMNDSLLHFRLKNNTIYAFDKLLSMFKGPYADSNHKLKSDVVNTTTHLRYKRKILSKNEQHRKCVKGNTRHSKYHIKTQVRDKKHGVLKSSRKFFTKKSSSGQRSKNTTINVHTRKIDESHTESKMKKRETENSGLNIAGAGSTDYEGMRADKSETLIKQSDSVLLTNDSRSKKQREENSVVLPFVHTGKAELRFRIEKIPANESSFINTDSWVDHSTTIGLSSTMSIQSKYGTIDDITDVTNSKLAPNFDYIERKGKEMDNIIKFTSSGIEADQNSEDEKYEKGIEKKVAKFADEDIKYRAKRNQQIMSKRYLQSCMNARRLKRFKNTGQNIGDIKHEGTMYKRACGNRAVRSIEEIKDLVEKLVVKVNELQMYVSNYSETPYTMTDSCRVDRKADRISKSSGKSNYKSEFVRDTDNHKRLTNDRQAISVEAKVFQVPSSVSRVTRANSRSKRKWNRWTDWSSCSVTCGKGRQIRWRHCLRDCDDAEIEMEEKACQLPACPPGKFLGIF